MVHFLVFVILGIILKRIAPASFSLDEAGFLRLSINPWIGDGLVLVAVAVVVMIAAFTFNRIEQPWREYGRSRISNLSTRRNANPKFGVYNAEAVP